jgi:hypothetical protein
LLRSCNYSVKVRRERLVVQMAVRVDQHSAVPI